MLTNVLLTALYAFLIFWALETIYVIWQAYKNDALPNFPLEQSPEPVDLKP
jgi:hypothetical protein